MLELAATGAQHGHAVPRGGTAGLGEEAGLADPRPPFDRNQPTDPADGRGDVRMHGGELRLSFEERRTARSQAHEPSRP